MEGRRGTKLKGKEQSIVPLLDSYLIEGLKSSNADPMAQSGNWEQAMHPSLQCLSLPLYSPFNEILDPPGTVSMQCKHEVDRHTSVKPI